MAKLTDKQRKKMVADRVNGMSIRALAEKYGVSTSTVQSTIKRDKKVTQKITQKKEQNTAEVLAYMDSKKKDVCDLIDALLKEMRDGEKIKATPLNQLATTMGILIDKFTANEVSRANATEENNLARAIADAAKHIGEHKNEV